MYFSAGNFSNYITFCTRVYYFLKEKKMTWRMKIEYLYGNDYLSDNCAIFAEHVLFEERFTHNTNKMTFIKYRF